MCQCMPLVARCYANNIRITRQRRAHTRLLLPPLQNVEKNRGLEAGTLDKTLFVVQSMRLRCFSLTYICAVRVTSSLHNQ